MKTDTLRLVLGTLIAVGGFLAAELPASAATTQVVLDDADVAKVVDAARQAMAERKVKGCIAIANAEGILIYFERQQGAFTNCNGSALVKAQAAAEFQADTQDMMEMLDKKGQLHLLKVPDMSPLPGGSPLRLDGKVVGGIGVSSPDGEIDIPIAKKAAAALSAH
jgi:uncharacterized protein GlcG (DUF336 family)